MKKSQILAALALAFALGVVAPVANTVVSSETYAADTTIDSRATLAQVKDAAASARKNSKVASYMAAIAAVEDAEDTEDAVVEPGTALTNLNAELKKFDAKYKDAEELTDALNSVKTVAPNYSKWATLIEAVENDDTSVSVDSKIKAITEAAKALGYTVTVGAETNNNTRLTNVIAQAKALSDYDGYNDLYTDVEAAQKTVETEAALRKALAGLGKSAAEIDAAAKNGINAANGLVAAIKAFPEYTPNAEALYAALEKVDDAEDGNTTGNAAIIDEIKTAYKTFTDKDLVITAGAANDNQGTGEGTNNGDNTNDDKKDPNAPDTGILADSEANASTTVAMVAGIATALTAAGAGVVAYRNARRSTRK